MCLNFINNEAGEKKIRFCETTEITIVIPLHTTREKNGKRFWLQRVTKCMHINSLCCASKVAQITFYSVKKYGNEEKNDTPITKSNEMNKTTNWKRKMCLSEQRWEEQRKKRVERMCASIYPLNMSKQCEHTQHFIYQYLCTHSTRIMTIIIMFWKYHEFLLFVIFRLERHKHCGTVTSSAKTNNIDDDDDDDNEQIKFSSMLDFRELNVVFMRTCGLLSVEIVNSKYTKRYQRLPFFSLSFYLIVFGFDCVDFCNFVCVWMREKKTTT